MCKRVCVLSLCIFLLIGSVGFCQVFPSGSWRMEPGLGWARPVTSFWGPIGIPTIQLSWAALGSITTNATALGRLSQFFGSGFGGGRLFDMAAAGDGKLKFDAQGLWLGATIPVRLTNSLTLRIQGEYFFPFSHRIWASAAGINTVSITDFVYGVPTGGPYTDERPGYLELHASVRTRWFFVDAELAYSQAMLGSTSILAGIRYDRLLSTIGPGASGNVVPPGPRSVIIPTSGSVTAELNSVSPYVGIRTRMGGPTGGMVFEVKGFPCIVFTQARYKRQNGYFGEFKAEYYCPFASNLSGSFFVRGDVIHATFTDFTNFTSLFSLDTVLPPGFTPSPAINQNAEVATSIHWNQLAIGGSLVLSF